MAAAWEFIQIVWSENFVLRAEFEELERFLGGLALKHVQILNNKLIFLRPSYSQSSLLTAQAVGASVRFP